MATVDDLRTGPLDRLSHTLWRQRRSLDLLIYKLEVEQVLLGAGRVASLGRAADEVDETLDRIREEELLRATHVEQVARLFGLGTEPGLQEIAEAADPPWDQIFGDHHQMLLGAVAAVEELSTVNRRLLTSGLSETRTFLTALDGSGPSARATGYGRDGSLETRSFRPTLFDSDV